MMRWAIYARYSSDLQDERSIDDQIRICRARVAELGGEVSEVYADYELSGAHLRSRPNAVRLLEDGKARRFDALIAEHTDRISRDQEDLAHLYKRLSHAGVRITTLFEGEIDEIRVGVGGMMGALFLKGLAQKIRRGQEGRVLKGSSAGGIGYGYRVVRAIDERGEPIRGLREIDPDQAEIVRRIFAEAAQGRSSRAIATGLNADGIPSPFGGIWRSSSIKGNRARGSGILWNSAYTGKLVYNRVTMVKDPDTGKRISRANPPDKWITTDAPHLRIIPDEDWRRVQRIMDGFKGLAIARRRRPRHALSGLVKCGVCGGAYTIMSADKLGCCNHREAGTCENGRTVRMPVLAERVFNGIRRSMLNPERIAMAMKEYHQYSAASQKAQRQRAASGADRIGEIDKKLAHIVTAISEGYASAALKAELSKLESEKAGLALVVADCAKADNVVEIIPSAANAYRKLLEDLNHSLASNLDASDNEYKIQLLRSLIFRIEIFPLPSRGEFEIRLHGSLSQMADLARGYSAGMIPSTVVVVAEERYRQDSTKEIISC